MFALAWDTATKIDCWSERDGGPPDFVLTEGAGQGSCFVYFELTPGGVVGTHEDSAEETLAVLEGEVVATVNGERRTLRRGDVAIVPAHAPHRVENRSGAPARVLGVFAAERVRSRFEQPLRPFGLTELETPSPPA